MARKAEEISERLIPEITDEEERGDFARKLNIKLEMFEGPFDLLLSLIEKQKIEIMDIPISLIADPGLRLGHACRHGDKIRH